MNNYVYWAEDDSEALEHHGILGQKWGVRRYQNEDGSLTSAGKKRYGALKTALAKLSTRQRNNHLGYNLKRLRDAKKQYETDPSTKNAKKVEDAKQNTKRIVKKRATAAAIGAAAGLTLAALSISVKTIPGRHALTGGGKQLPEIAGFMQLPSIANRYVNTIAE